MTLSIISVRPCHSLLSSHLSVTLAQLRSCWLRLSSRILSVTRALSGCMFFLFLCCRILHESVIVVRVMVLKRDTGVVGRPGDIGHRFVVTFTTCASVEWYLILGHVTQVSLLLDLLHWAGLGVRYWVSLISWHVDFGLLSCTRHFYPTRNELGALGFWVFFGGRARRPYWFIDNFTSRNNCNISPNS